MPSFHAHVIATTQKQDQPPGPEVAIAQKDETHLNSGVVS